MYGSGEEPDARFSFANERTFLAWIRTALALLAAGVALDIIDPAMSAGVQRSLAALFVLASLVCAVAAWVRWARAERAMRRGEPLPAATLSAVLTGVMVVAVGIILLFGL